MMLFVNHCKILLFVKIKAYFDVPRVCAVDLASSVNAQSFQSSPAHLTPNLSYKTCYQTSLGFLRRHQNGMPKYYFLIGPF